MPDASCMPKGCAIEWALEGVRALLTHKIASVFSMFRVINKEKLRFFVFFVVSFILGGLGLLLPCIKAYKDDLNVVEAWNQLLFGGNGYTFAAAILAGAGAFVVNDIVEWRKTSFVGVRVFAGLTLLLIFLWLIFLLTPHFDHMPPWSTRADRAAEVTVSSGNPATTTKGVTSSSASEKANLSSSGLSPTIRVATFDTWQTTSLAIAMLFSIWLFCLQNSEKHYEHFPSLLDDRNQLIKKAGKSSGTSRIKM